MSPSSSPCRAAFSAALLAFVIHAHPAAAAENAADPEILEEVVVTAWLRSAPLEQVPTSVTVLGRRTLEQAGQQHFEDVIALVPNLTFAGGTSRPRFFQLRGVGELEQYQGAPNPSVGFLIDDIDFSGVGMPATLFDIDRIEVLRGPQGTIYGANALAGLVSVRTRDPQARPELDLEATAGDYGTYSGGIAAGGPLPGAPAGNESTDPAWRVALQDHRSDGYRRDVFLGRDDTSDFRERSARGKLRLRPSDDLTVLATAMLADLDNGYDAWALDNSRNTRSDRPGRDTQRSRALGLRADYAGFTAFDVRALASVAASDSVYSFDGDWGNDAYWAVDPPYDYDQRFDRDRRTVSGELRATSRNLEGTRWTAGLYALRLSEDLHQVDRYDGAPYNELTSAYAATNAALYAQVEQPLASRLTLTAGLRGERRAARYVDSNARREDPRDHMLGGQLSLTWQVDARHSVYGTVSRGYKAGGFNISTQVAAEQQTFAPEYLWNFEAGLHARGSDGRWQAQVAAFYMRRLDQQVSASFQLDPTDPNTFAFVTANAARGENYGLEGQLRWQPLAHWEVAAGLALLQAQYVSFQFGGLDLDGREQASAPEYQYSLGVTFSPLQHWYARVDLQGSDDFYFDTSNDQRAPAFSLVNARIGFSGVRWRASLWARNLFDADHPTRGFFFANDPLDFTPRRFVAAGEPRHYGVTLGYSY